MMMGLVVFVQWLFWCNGPSRALLVAARDGDVNAEVGVLVLFRWCSSRGCLHCTRMLAHVEGRL